MSQWLDISSKRVFKICLSLIARGFFRFCPKRVEGQPPATGVRSHGQSVADDETRAVVKEVVGADNDVTLAWSGGAAGHVLGMGDVVVASGHPHHHVSVNYCVIVIQVSTEVQNRVKWIALSVDRRTSILNFFISSHRYLYWKKQNKHKLYYSNDILYKANSNYVNIMTSLQWSFEMGVFKWQLKRVKRQIYIQLKIPQ